MMGIPDFLPGADLVCKGIADLNCGIVTEESALVSIGAHRIRRAGIEVPAGIPDPEGRLYAMISRTHGNGAHSYYNSLIRRLVSFEQALECAKK